MKKILSAVIALGFVGSAAFAEMKSVNAIMKKANAEEQKDLSKLLSQITLAPTKDPTSGKPVFKVIQITKGSIYEREGLKVGDLVLQ